MQDPVDSANKPGLPRWKTWFVSFAVGLFGSLALLFVVGAAYIFWLKYYVLTPYQRVMRGDDKSQVVALLGRPNRVIGPPENAVWEDGASFQEGQSGCVEQFWYEPPSIIGDAWTVGFDAHGSAVGKYHYSSP